MAAKMEGNLGLCPIIKMRPKTRSSAAILGNTKNPLASSIDHWHKIFKSDHRLRKGGCMEEIEDMIIEILASYRGKWPQDIIDQVFVAIEQDPRKLKRYHEFADGDYATTNSMIGRFVKDYTGLNTVKVTDHPKSKLIKNYTILG
jgi:hypothetical protein